MEDDAKQEIINEAYKTQFDTMKDLIDAFEALSAVDPAEKDLGPVHIFAKSYVNERIKATKDGNAAFDALLGGNKRTFDKSRRDEQIKEATANMNRRQLSGVLTRLREKRPDLLAALYLPPALLTALNAE